MAQLRPGASEALAHLISDLEWMKEKAYNPEAVIAYADKCIERLNTEIRPRLQRAEPTLEQRLNEQGAQHQKDIEELRAQIALLASQKIVVVREEPLAAERQDAAKKKLAEADEQELLRTSQFM